MTRLITTRTKFWGWVVFAFLSGLLAGYIFGAQVFVAKEAEATFTPHVDICHATPPDTAANGWVQNSPSIPQLVAHITQHDADIIPPFGQYPGKNWDEEGQAIYRNGCVVPPPPDVCENIEGVQEETPENMTNEQGYCDCQEGYHREYEEEYQEAGDGDSFSCVPDEEPTPTPTPEPEPEVTSEPGGPPAPQVCEGRDLGGWAPTIDQVGRIDADTVFAHWTSSTPNADDYILWYGLSEDSQPWNIKVENSQYAEVSGSQLTGHVWFRVQATDNCQTGPVSVAVDP